MCSLVILTKLHRKIPHVWLQSDPGQIHCIKEQNRKKSNRGKRLVGMGRFNFGVENKENMRSIEFRMHLHMYILAKEEI